MLLQCLVTALLVTQHVCGEFGASEPSPSDTAQRLDQLERLLVHQAAEVTSLKYVGDQQVLQQVLDLLREQLATIASQQLLLKEQTAELASYKRLLQSQNVRLQHVEDVLNRKADQPCKSKTVLSLRQRADDLGPLEAVVDQLSLQMTSTASDVQALKTSISQQGQLIQDARTSTFVRWGHSQCVSASELVYSGVVGGSYFDHSGAAANYLCLTLSPVPGNHKTTFARLYGTEYQTLDAVQNKDAACAVCRTAYTTTVMIPGTNVCTQGWHPQYSGYLMAGAYSHSAASEFICVDSALQYMPHSDPYETGKQMYYTSAVCGSLPCSPYVNGTTVLCVVCSK